MGTLCAALVLLFAVAITGAAPALAQFSGGCTAINNGDLNGTLPPNNKQVAGFFSAGDAIVVTWTNQSSILIQVDSANVHSSSLANGSFSIPTSLITGGNHTIRWSGLSLTGQTGTVSANCDGGGGTVTPPPELDFLEQIHFQDALAKNSTFPPGFLESMYQSHAAGGCDIAALRTQVNFFTAARQDAINRYNSILEQYPGLTPDGPAANAAEHRARSFLHDYRGQRLDAERRLAAAEAELARCNNSQPLMYAAPIVGGNSGPLSAFDLLMGGGRPADGFVFSQQYTPLAYAGDSLIDGLPSMLMDGEWSFWTAGSISGLNGTAPAFRTVSGRIALGATFHVTDELSVGGFLGLSSTSVTAAGTVRSIGLMAGPYIVYSLSEDMTITVAAGGSLGSLATTLGADSGTTGTQGAFLAASLNGTLWSDGRWTVSGGASLTASSEHQNAFTTANGVAVPAQTISQGSASANLTISYALSTELPMEVFTTLGVGVGNTAGAAGLSGSIGGGLSLTRDALHATVSTTVGLVGAVRSWSLSGSLGASF